MVGILKYKKSAGLIIIGFLTLAGCNIGDIPDLNNTYLPNYEGEIALILLKDTLVINEFFDKIISDSNALSEGSNKEIIFKYETETTFDVGKDFVEVEDYTNSKYLASPWDTGGAFVTTQDTTLVFDETADFSFIATGKEAVDSVFYSAGDFDLELNSSFPAGVTINYTFTTPAFQEKITSAPIAVTSSLSPTSGTPPFIENTSRDLGNYKTSFQNQGDSNVFVAEIDATVFIPAGTSITGSEYLNFSLAITNQEFEIVFGDFGKDTIEIPSKRISLGLFGDLSGSGIKFENPQIDFAVTNSFGIPIGIDFSGTHAQYSDGPDVPMQGSVTESLQDIAAPPVANYANPTVESTLSINSENSNLRDLLADSPDRLVLPLTGYSNPGTGPYANFVSDVSTIDIVATISMPMSVQLDGFEYDTDIEIGDLKELEGTKELSLLFITSNELPFDGSIDLFFLDENGVRFDSLTGNVLFKAPDTYDENGKVSVPAESRTEIVLDEDKINSLVTSSSLTLVTRLNSFGFDQDEFVTIFSDYTMATSLSVAGKLSVDLNGN